MTQPTLRTLVLEVFPDLPWQFEFPLAALTYFKLGGPAEVWLETSDAQVVAQIKAWCQKNQLKLTILGGASNCIVADEGVRGIVLRFTNDGVELHPEAENGKRRVLAGAGAKMALLVRKTLDWELTGLEYFLGVPGTLGGAIVNNAHYLADLIGKHVSRVQVVSNTGELIWLPADECEFQYDHSRFQKSGEIVVKVEFLLAPGDPKVSAELVKKATLYRAETQPLGLPSSGCIFQNSPNTPELKALFPQFADKAHVSAGFLIDQAGLKGERVGDIVVSQKHAAFMINQGQGTAADVQALIARVKASVKAKFGVDLREEVFYLGT